MDSFAHKQQTPPILDTKYIPAHTWKTWAMAAAVHAVYAVGGILYGSSALNLYLPPQYEFYAQDIDAYVVASTPAHFDALLKQLYEHVRAGCAARSGGAPCSITTAFRFPHASLTVTLSINGVQFADITRQLWPNPVRVLFPVETVLVVDEAAKPYYLSVISLDEIKHRLVATVHSLPYADGGEALSPEANGWRIGKDGLRLQRIMELEASGLVLHQPRDWHVNAFPAPTPTTVVWAGHGDRSYCMPVPLTFTLLGVAAVPAEEQVAVLSPVVLPTPVASSVPEHGFPTFVLPRIDLPDAVQLPVAALAAYDHRLQRAEARVRTLACCLAARRSKQIRKCAQGFAKLRGDFKRMRGACIKEFVALNASVSAACDDFCAQLSLADRERATRVARAHSEEMGILTTRKNTALRAAADAIHTLETNLFEKHRDRVEFQRLVCKQLEAYTVDVQRCSVLTNDVGLADFQDMYSITLESLCAGSVEPFFWVDTLEPADILSTQMEVMLLRAHQIHSGHWDHSPPIKFATLRGADCEEWTTCILPTVEAQRANFLNGLKESMLALCLSPPLRRLRDLSLTVDTVCRKSAEAVSAIRAACIAEVMNSAPIRASHAVRMKCVTEMQQ